MLSKALCSLGIKGSFLRRTSVILALSIALPGSALAQLDIQYILLSKVVARANNAPESQPYEAEFCLEGTDIVSATLSAPTTPDPTDYSYLNYGDEWCVSLAYADSPGLEAAFPNGTYTVTVVGTDRTDTKSVAYNLSEPLGYLEFTDPLPNATDVGFADGLSFQWIIHEKAGGAGCGTAGTCADSINVDAVILTTDEEVLDETIPANSTSLNADALLFMPFTEYESEIEMVNGSQPVPSKTDGDDDILLESSYEDVNLIEFTTGDVPMDIEEIGVFKYIDRVDGVPVAIEPYGIEACVVGSGIVSASVTPQGEDPIDLFQEDDEWCADDSFDTLADLNNAYANGNYLFEIEGESESDSKTLNLQASVPLAHLDITNPALGETISPNADLDFTWVLTENPGGEGCITAENCGDTLFVSIEDDSTGEELFNDLLPLDATNVLVPADDLEPGNDLFAEAEVIKGDADFDDTTDGGDPIESFAIFEDINQIWFMAPEPTSLTLQVFALATLAGTCRTRRRRE